MIPGDYLEFSACLKAAVLAVSKKLLLLEGKNYPREEKLVDALEVLELMMIQGVHESTADTDNRDRWLILMSRWTLWWFKRTSLNNQFVNRWKSTTGGGLGKKRQKHLTATIMQIRLLYALCCALCEAITFCQNQVLQKHGKNVFICYCGSYFMYLMLSMFNTPGYVWFDRVWGHRCLVEKVCYVTSGILKSTCLHCTHYFLFISWMNCFRSLLLFTWAGSGGYSAEECSICPPVYGAFIVPQLLGSILFTHQFSN